MGCRLARVVVAALAVAAVAGGTALAAAADSVPLSTAFSDPLAGQEWWLGAVGAGSLEPPGPGKPVTVVDSGLDVSHPEFANRPDVQLLNAQTVAGQEEDHGTSVSSVIGAPSNGIGVVGIYPQALLRSWDASPTRFGIEDAMAIAGIDGATLAGPGVVNLSWGSDRPESELELAIARAVRAGLLVVAAAGNDRQRGDPPIYPASSPHVLTVGASDEQNRVAFFSSSSPGMDVVAPGLDIPVADPFAGGGFTNAAGTSFAAPIVAGAAAWLWTARPDLDASQVAELLRRTATDLGPPGWDADSGFGVIDLEAALAAPAPAPDPEEPNDDVVDVRADGVFASPTPLLTSPSRRRATLAGRVASTDDPIDLYRLWLPARSRVRVTARAADGRPLTVSLWGADTGSVRESGGRRHADLLDSGAGVASASGGKIGSVAYVELAAGANRHTEYSLSITTSAAR
jgi:subtilisin family serine protease